MSFNNHQNWIILNPIEEKIKTKIESKGTPLSLWNIKINRGVLTGYNEAFIISEETMKKLVSADSKSAEIIRPILRGRDIERYKYNYCNLYMICTFPSLKYDINNYKGIKNYLLSFGKERLEQTGETHIINGKEIKSRKKTNNKWFETQDSISYWDEFNKQKLVWTPVNSEYRFAIIPKGYVFNNSLFMMTGDKIELICAVLNSDLYRFYLYTMFSNGNYTYGSSAFFSKLPVIKETTLFGKIKQLVDTINDNYADKIIELNNIIYGLYDISPEEIDFITKKLVSL